MTNLATRQLSRVGTVTKWAISVEIVPNLVISARSNAPTVIKVCWPFPCIELQFADGNTVGHTKVRCKEPLKIEDGGYGAAGDTGGVDVPADGDTGGFDAAASGGDFAAPTAGGGDDWTAGSGGATDEWGTAPATTTVGGEGGGSW